VTRLLYVDAVGGLAGDMLLAALVDAGAPLDQIRAGLDGLRIDGLELRMERAVRHGIGAARVTAAAPDPQPHRRWRTIRDQLAAAGLPPRAHDRAQAIFRRLAVAEGRIHGIDPDDVHFHEVGAVDALAEVAGVALALEALAVDELACSPLPAPRGLVAAAHGRLPLPAPATLELLRGAPLEGVDARTEMVTPTGAAIVAALATRWGPLPPLTLADIGYGAGARDTPERPNLVRVLIGTAAAEGDREPVALLEANLDDLVPELVPDAADACFAAGALDVWTEPATMKHGRPGVVLRALARPADEDAVADAVLRETTTLGVRVARLERRVLAREEHPVEVDGQRVRVKVARRAGAVANVKPEHADCAAAARVLGLPVKVVWARAMAAAQEVAR